MSLYTISYLVLGLLGISMYMCEVVCEKNFKIKQRVNEECREAYKKEFGWFHYQIHYEDPFPEANGTRNFCTDSSRFGDVQQSVLGESDVIFHKKMFAKKHFGRDTL